MNLLCLLTTHNWSNNAHSLVLPNRQVRFCTRCLRFESLELVDFGRHKVWIKLGNAPKQILPEGEVEN